MREGKLTVKDLVERKQVTLGIEEAVSLISGK
jgi:hypothetical protein